MPGKGSVSRKRAVKADVEKRVLYAFSSLSHANPYSQDDKRYDLFSKALSRRLAIAHDFEDMCVIHGCDTSTWTKREHPDPVLLFRLTNWA